MNQEEYCKKYKALADRYQSAAKQYEEAEQQIAEADRRVKQTEGFISTVRDLGPLTEFDTGLWGILIDSITVYSKEDIRVEFKK